MHASTVASCGAGFVPEINGVEMSGRPSGEDFWAFFMNYAAHKLEHRAPSFQKTFEYLDRFEVPITIVRDRLRSNGLQLGGRRSEHNSFGPLRALAWRGIEGLL